MTLTVGRRVGARIEALAELKARRYGSASRAHLRGINRTVN
jgi:hypothetical protein